MWVIVLAASAGGISALQQLVAALPADLPAAVIVVQHRTIDSRLQQLLSRRSLLPIKMAEEGGAIEAGVIYLARPDLHLMVKPDRKFEYIDGRRIRFVRSSANPLFESAARAFRNRAIGVVLTGFGRDGTDGVQAVKAGGGIVIAEDPFTADQSGMPMSAISTGAVDYVLPLAAIAPTLMSLIRSNASGVLTGHENRN
jgi:two-component system chemotaxis response regulator CheB